VKNFSVESKKLDGSFKVYENNQYANNSLLWN
jgi:hypothetical protein